MLAVAAPFLSRIGVTECAVLPMEAFCVTYASLLEREGPLAPKSVLLYLLPYYTGPSRNLSLYAVSRDYHILMREIGEGLASALSAAYPGASFRAFSDHSPIDERHAASVAGLGCLGDNGLLINRRYGSFVFIGEVFSDLEAPVDTKIFAPTYCEHCGACRRACPTGALSGEGECLSELTQRKGELAPATVELMRKHRTVWGCDLCQTACPHNRRVLEDGGETPLAFFYEERIPYLTSERLAAMSREELATRAFGWRGRPTIARNLAAYEQGDLDEDKKI